MAFIRKRENKGGETFEVHYQDPSGKRRSRTFKTKTDAREYRSHVENALRSGEWRDPALGKIKFAEYAEQWLESELNLKPATRLNYSLLLRKHVFPYFEDAPLSGIEPEHVQRWVKKLDAKGMSPGSVRNAFRVFFRVLSEAERHRRIVSNPARGTRLPKRSKTEMQVLNPEQISRLADAIEPRYRALILLAGWTGARWGEIAALEVKSLDLLHGNITIRQSFSEVSGVLHVVTPKTGEARDVPLPRFLVQELERHLAEYPSGQYVFTSPTGGPLRKTWYQRSFLPALKSAGVPKVRFHDLRHSAATIALEELGASVTQVASMLGHSSPMVTLTTYSHLLDKGMNALRQGMQEAFDAVPLREAR
jgi:integrase